MSFETFDDLLNDAGYGHCVELTDAVADTVPSDDNVEAAAIINIEVARLRRAVDGLPAFDAWLLRARYGLRGQPTLSTREGLRPPRSGTRDRSRSRGESYQL